MSTIANCTVSSCPASQVEDAVDKAVKEELTKDLDEQRSSQAQASTSSRAGPGGDPRDAAGKVLVLAHSDATSPCGQTSSSQQGSGCSGMLQGAASLCLQQLGAGLVDQRPVDLAETLQVGPLSWRSGVHRWAVTAAGLSGG